MKKYFLVLMLSPFPYVIGIAQTNTFPSSGNAGIGTTSPTYLLSLGTTAKGFAEYNSGGATDAIKAVGNNLGSNCGTQNLNANGFSGVEYFDHNGNVACFTGYNNGNPGEFRYNNVYSGGFFTFKIAGTDRFYVANSGNIGISTSSPGEKLEVNGKVKAAGLILTTGAASGKVLTSDGSGNATWQTAAASGWALNGSTVGTTKSIGTVDNYDLPLITNNTERMRILAGGGIAIGTTSLPAVDAKLAVNGNIYSRKVKVTQSSWADYVFHSGYRLRPLSEVEAYIRLHKHLPEVPSASQ